MDRIAVTLSLSNPLARTDQLGAVLAAVMAMGSTPLHAQEERGTSLRIPDSWLAQVVTARATPGTHPSGNLSPSESGGPTLRISPSWLAQANAQAEEAAVERPLSGNTRNNRRVPATGRNGAF